MNAPTKTASELAAELEAAVLRLDAAAKAIGLVIEPPERRNVELETENQRLRIELARVETELRSARGGGPS